MRKKRMTAALLVLVFVLCQSLTAFAMGFEDDGEFFGFGDPDMFFDDGGFDDIIEYGEEPDDFEDGNAYPDVEPFDDSMSVDTAGNMFWAGDDLSLSLKAFYTAFLTGKNIKFNEVQAEGSVFAVAKDVEIEDSDIEESAFLMAELASLKDSYVRGNVFAMGRKVDVSGKNSAVYAMGQNLNLDCDSRFIYAAGQTVNLGGRIEGDVYVTSGTPVVYDSDLYITGSLKVTAPSENKLPEGASVGSYEFTQSSDKADEGKKKGAGSVIRGLIIRKILKTIYLIIAFVLLGLLICKFFDGDLNRAGNDLKKTPIVFIIRGFFSLALIPIAAVIMCITVFLAPAGGLLMLAYLLLLLTSISFIGASIGRILFPKMNNFGSAAICIAVLELLRQIPFVGRVIALAAYIYIFAYVTGIIWDNLKKRKERLAGASYKAALAPVPAASGAMPTGAVLAGNEEKTETGDRGASDVTEAASARAFETEYGAGEQAALTETSVTETNAGESTDEEPVETAVDSSENFSEKPSEFFSENSAENSEDAPGEEKPGVIALGGPADTLPDVPKDTPEE